ncbi:putative NTF2-nuclear transport factor [Microstroma glucosiphilum]|uniref:Nuclear transport factor 2 n=1 Tax=Pseudomicrostroma glucosiphilum TaxID=1684307 RepID=A0A316UJG9_9BASI|nr:putative NTF2-nuclear transport factor [Pseudomicrostroma glucosiphilum]PWN24103.1 putative NTF2-nuclear transport factor [Pseudomicrostroma glucosiphilum]
MEAIAQSFTDYYYTTFDSNRAGLAPLYRANSMLTFEGTQLQGVEAIVEKLSSLPFQKVEHKVSTRDCQPTGDGNSLVVIVTGALMVDDSPAPLNFSQTFVLNPEGGSYYVFNDLFRLNYG